MECSRKPIARRKGAKRAEDNLTRDAYEQICSGSKENPQYYVAKGKVLAHGQSAEAKHPKDHESPECKGDVVCPRDAKRCPHKVKKNKPAENSVDCETILTSAHQADYSEKTEHREDHTTLKTSLTCRAYRICGRPQELLTKGEKQILLRDEKHCRKENKRTPWHLCVSDK
jgi:hypothetical protein